jgi:alpha-beta hydrolase superfamily lysophospholipase
VSCDRIRRVVLMGHSQGGIIISTWVVSARVLPSVVSLRINHEPMLTAPRTSS